jgi:HD superfamily phosphohydrolase
MTKISFADVVHPLLTFDTNDSAQSLVLQLIDTSWVQRLRDIGQTANTRQVYMFSEHSRFGHCVGAAYLACQIMSKLEDSFPAEVKKYKNAIAAAAILHDIGHLAPGSHIAQKIWFPDQPDTHELIGSRIIMEDPEISNILKNYEPGLIDNVCKILKEDDELPPWTWELISGGGWNVDRGNWCSVDSVLSGVSYGRYNIPALTDAIVITEDQHLALNENRLDAMLHFIISRHAMYSQIYQHRVLLAADTLNFSIVKRARYLNKNNTLEFADTNMLAALSAETANNLSLMNIYWMREAWWRYHVYCWTESKDAILSDLSKRYLNRKLLKTIRINNSEPEEQLNKKCLTLLNQNNFDPEYYFHKVSTSDVHAGDSHKSMRVLMNTGETISLKEAHPLFKSLVGNKPSEVKSWLVLPQEIKKLLK